MNNNENILLSIIIPVYNGELYLENAIESAINQPGHKFEIIVVDDGSTDCSLKIAYKYKNQYDKIVKIIHTDNYGVSHARNLGIENAQGKYVSFLDADDVLCSGAYNNELESMLAKEEYELFSMSYIFGSNDLKYGSLQNVTDGKIIKYEKDTLREYDSCKHHSSFVISRILLIDNSELRYPEHIKRNEDFVFMYLILQKVKSIYELDVKWFIYRDNLESTVHRSKVYDYVITDSLPAWDWCKKTCSDKNAKDGCDIRTFAVAIEYIQDSCTVGIPLREIMKVCNNEIFKESLNNYDKFWNSKKKIYENFVSHPVLFWFRYRIKGIPRALGRKFARMRFVRPFYSRLKYKKKIGKYIRFD